MIASPNDLVYFIELSNILNFSRASERIGISQPSLSIAIKRLEQSIGTELFIRSKNGLALTQAGKRLLSHTKELLQLWNTVKSESLASHHEIQGSFIFGIHSSLALHFLPGFLPNLLVNYPKLEIQLKHDLSRKILEEIVSLSIHIGIIVNPVRHPDLIIQKLYDDKMTFWHSKNLKKVYQQLRSGNVVIIGDPELVQTQWLLKQFHQQGFKFQRFITSSSLELIANLTANSVGVGILPTSVALSACPGMLEPILSMPTYNDEICLVYRNENRNIKAMQTIISAIKSYFKTQRRG